MNSQKEFEFSTPQIKVINSRTPLTLFMAGQRLGKTFSIGFKSGRYISNAPRIVGMIAANTHLQLTQTTIKEVKKAWKKIYGYTEYDPKANPNGHYVVGLKPPDHFTVFEKFSNYYSIISFINGGIIFTASLVNYMAHDGKEIGWAELDETKDTKEDALKAVILARLSQPGFVYHKETLEYAFVENVPEEERENYIELNPLCINTSPSVGVVKWLTDMFGLQKVEADVLKALTGSEKMYFSQSESETICLASTHHNAHNLSKGYIKNRLSKLSEGEGLKYIYGYPFARTGDSYYRNFEKLKHVRSVFYQKELPIHLAFDFNSKPYMTELCAQVVIDEKLKHFNIQFFKEYCLSSPYNSTADVCEAFFKDFVLFNPMVFYYGDASGDYRQAGSGDHTQFDTVREVLKPFLSRSSDRVPRGNKRVLNRRDFVDRILEDKLVIDYNGSQYLVQIIIDPKCEKLSEDMQWLKESLDGKLKEKEKDAETGVVFEKLGHCSDAMEDFICELLEDYYNK